MSAYTEPELAALIAGFCDRTLPIEAWTHQAHVATATMRSRLERFVRARPAQA